MRTQSQGLTKGRPAPRKLLLAAVAVTSVVTFLSPPSSAAPDPAPSPAPRDTAECPVAPPGHPALVSLTYQVLLRRCSDAPGQAYWAQALDDGLSAELFARRIAFSLEAREVVVHDAYEMMLDRPSDADGRRWWAQWLQPHPTAPRRYDHLLAQLAGSHEFWTLAGSTNGGFVDRVYARVLDRPADAGGRAHWIARLDAGQSRTTLVRTLVRLSEPLGVIVSAAHREILDREPTTGERGDQVRLLRADGSRPGLSARLLGTYELYQRAQAIAPGPGRYVALGDSYVSGEGNPPYEMMARPEPPPGVALPPGAPTPSATMPHPCHRSAASYAESARILGGPIPGTLDLAACSGAKLRGVYPQLAALDGENDPDLVTVTIGGNDIGFVPILTACLQVELAGDQLNPEYSDAACDRWLDERAPAALDGLRTGLRDGENNNLLDCGGHACTLAALFADIAAAAPDARIAVVGYPPLLPPSDGDCAGPVQVDGRPFPGARWKLAAQYVPRGRALIVELNDALRDAAESAEVTFVDPTTRFAGHHVCSAEPYIYGLRIGGGGIDPASFHPTRAGGQAVAAAVAAALDD